MLETSAQKGATLQRIASLLIVSLHIASLRLYSKYSSKLEKGAQNAEARTWKL